MDVLNESFKWHQRFMHRAIEVGSYSKDPEIQVGAVIVGPDRDITAEGFNGFPRRMEDLSHQLENRAFLKDNILHAEMNAYINASRKGAIVKDHIVYTTRPSCPRCTSFLSQAGIAAVIFLEQSSEYHEEHKLVDIIRRHERVGIDLYQMNDKQIVCLSKPKK